MFTMPKIAHILFTIILVSNISLAAAPSDTGCRDYDEVYYEKTNNDFLKRIALSKLDSDMRAVAVGNRSQKESSPQGTRNYVIQSPDFMKQGPWHTVVYVRGNKARPVGLRIAFLDHGRGGVRVKWLNERLVFIQVWWGRIVSTDLILDIDTAQWVYAEDANYGNLIMSCDEKTIIKR